MGQEKIKFPQNAYINGKVSIGPITKAFGIAAELNIYLGNIDKGTANSLVKKKPCCLPVF